MSHRLIRPTAVYSVAEAANLIGLPTSCLIRDSRRGILRVSRRGKKHFILGAWLLGWIEAGEVRRGHRETPVAIAA